MWRRPADRFTLLALNVGDIVELLPAGAVLGVDRTGVRARSACRSAASTKAFKDWLVAVYHCSPIRAQDSESNRDQDALPAELEELSRGLTEAHKTNHDGVAAHLTAR